MRRPTNPPGSWTTSSLIHFGTMLGSGATALGCAEMPGSTSGGGQITRLDRDNASLKLALPVVSPGGTTKPPVLARQPKFGVDEIPGGAGRSGCADAFVTAAIIVAATIIQRSHSYLLSLSSRKTVGRGMLFP
jgi:hypothetical protein